MGRCLGANVAEGKSLLVLINDVGWNFSPDNFTEYGFVSHGIYFVRISLPHSLAKSRSISTVAWAGGYRLGDLPRAFYVRVLRGPRSLLSRRPEENFYALHHVVDGGFKLINRHKPTGVDRHKKVSNALVVHVALNVFACNAKIGLRQGARPESQ